MIAIEKHFQDISIEIQELPDKLHFKIGEVSDFLKVATYVLRYWEKEFPSLRPEKFINKQRLYSKKDIQNLLLIKKLLYEEKFSIEGLRKHLPSYIKIMKNTKKQDQPEEFLEKKDILEKKLKGLLHSINDIRKLIHQSHF